MPPPPVVALALSRALQAGERLCSALLPQAGAAPHPHQTCCAAQVREMSRELRDFDTLLAEREEQRRLEQWRRERRQ